MLDGEPHKSAGFVSRTLRQFPNILSELTSGIRLAGLAILVIMVLAIVSMIILDSYFGAAVALLSVIGLLWCFMQSIVQIKDSTLRSEINDPEVLEYRYDAFISAPMEASEGDFQQQQKEFIDNLKKTLRQQLGLENIYYGGTDIETEDSYNHPAIGYNSIREALQRSRYFVFVYPQNLPSSVLIELGMALAHGKPCLLFIHQDARKPYLLRGALESNKTVTVEIAYSNLDGLISQIETDGSGLLDTLKS